MHSNIYEVQCKVNIEMLISMNYRIWWIKNQAIDWPKKKKIEEILLYLGPLFFNFSWKDLIFTKQNGLLISQSKTTRKGLYLQARRFDYNFQRKTLRILHSQTPRSKIITGPFEKVHPKMVYRNDDDDNYIVCRPTIKLTRRKVNLSKFVVNIR